MSTPCQVICPHHQVSILGQWLFFNSKAYTNIFVIMSGRFDVTIFLERFLENSILPYFEFFMFWRALTWGIFVLFIL